MGHPVVIDRRAVEQRRKRFFELFGAFNVDADYFAGLFVDYGARGSETDDYFDVGFGIGGTARDFRQMIVVRIDLHLLVCYNVSCFGVRTVLFGNDVRDD